MLQSKITEIVNKGNSISFFITPSVFVARSRRTVQTQFNPPAVEPYIISEKENFLLSFFQKRKSWLKVGTRKKAGINQTSSSSRQDQGISQCIFSSQLNNKTLH